MMAGHFPTNVTSDHIQRYLDENKSLILKIVESQNSGNLSDCAENQARLQRNLMYLAAIADSHPQPPSLQRQFSSGNLVHSGAAAVSQQGYAMSYSQQPYATLQHYQQQQEAALQGHILSRPADASGGFPDFFHNFNMGSSGGAGNNGDGVGDN